MQIHGYQVKENYKCFNFKNQETYEQLSFDY